ncbi:glyoxalase [Arthrobacter sp. MYb211]|uniref:VOC family protein n=1 Tax=unclassified Arthrobacter TaxID=235627 RepID=UPI000CFB9CE1|nr:MULTISPECIES: VOC family protein [unclassified Arthrobacter]PRA10957.1 glyoxalase [Arthrobacter sp. MYb221]PRC07111.1 glyoxalase [Arthrobacter sp. MYb211]
MGCRFAELAVDCKNPVLIARFWGEVFDYSVLSEEAGLVTIGPAEATKDSQGPVLTFAQVPEEKTIKNRVHLDVRPVDCTQDEEVERLLSLGAKYAEVESSDFPWIVLLDPEGNEFCVLSEQEA